MEALPLARVKAFLVEHEVSFSDCFERSELLARYAEVKRRIDALEEQRLRALANRCSQRKSYELAVRYYSDALRVPASSTLHAQLYANRSAAYLSLGMCRAAMEDGQRAVDLDPTYIKGFLRLGSAELAIGRGEAAVKTFQAALALVDSADEQSVAWRTILSEKLEQAQTLAAAARSASQADAAEPLEPAEPAASTDAAPPSPLGAKLLDHPDLLAEIFSALSSAADVCRASRTCTAFARVASSPLLWRALCERTFGDGLARLGLAGGGLTCGSGLNISSDDGQAPPRDWRVLFRERRLRDRLWEDPTSAGKVPTIGFLTGPGGHSGPVYGVCMRGGILASSSEDGLVLVWDLATRTVLHTLRAHCTGILGVWLAPNCRRLASGGFDSNLKLWGLPQSDGSAAEEAAARVERNCIGHTGPIVSCLGISGAGADAHEPARQGVAPQAAPAPAAAAGVLTTSFDGTMRHWSWESGRLVRTYEDAHVGHACGLAYDEKAAIAFTGGDDGLVKIWDLRTANNVDCTPEGHAVEGAVWALAVSEHTLAAGATGGSLTVWDLRRGLSSRPLASRHDAHDDAVAGLQITDNGRTILTSSFDSTVRLWDSPMYHPSTRLRGTIRVPHTRCTRLAADDTRIVVGCIGQHIAVIDVL